MKLIAAFKLFKAAALLVSLAALFRVVDASDPVYTVLRAALYLHVDPNSHYLSALMSFIVRLDATHVALLAVGTTIYALLFLIEGIGLWLEKRWAEFLTIIVTAGLLPLEAYELAKGVSVSKLVTLAVNLAIVAYLIWRVRHHTDAAQLAADASTPAGSHRRDTVSAGIESNRQA